MNTTDAQLREKAKAWLLSAREALARDGWVRTTVVLICPDGTELSTCPEYGDEAGKEWCFASISECARRLQAIAAVLVFQAVITAQHQAGSYRPPGVPLGDDERSCIFVALRIPGQPDWGCVAPYEQEAGTVRFLDDEEPAFVCPLLPDWWVGEAGRA